MSAENYREQTRKMARSLFIQSAARTGLVFRTDEEISELLFKCARTADFFEMNFSVALAEAEKGRIVIPVMEEDLL